MLIKRRCSLLLEFVAVVEIQDGYSIIDRQDDKLVEFARQREIAVVPFFPPGSAFWGGPARLAGEAAIVQDKPGATPAHMALACDRMLLIPGTSSTAHREENMAAIELELDDGDLAALDLVEQRDESAERSRRRVALSRAPRNPSHPPCDEVVAECRVQMDINPYACMPRHWLFPRLA